MKPISLITLLLILTLAVGATRGLAQQEEKPVPKPPYIAPVLANGHWTITLDISDNTADKKVSPAAEQIPTTIDTIKTGNIKRVTMHFKNGTSKRYDQVDGYFLTESPSGAKLSVQLAPDAPPYPFYTEGYLFIDDLEPKTFKDVVKYKGVDCFHYQGGSLDVWIAIDSMLPVAAKLGDTTASFQFLPALNAPIALPADEAAVLQKEIKAYDKFRDMR